MWTNADLYPPCRVSPGLRTVSWGMFTAVYLLLIGMSIVDTCYNPTASACYIEAVKKLQTVNCQSNLVVPELQTCVHAAIGDCARSVVIYWDKKIADLKSSLDNIVATSTLSCNIACPTQAAETKKISDCSNGFTTVLDQIKTGGSNSENVSASCKKAQTAITCLNNAGSCLTTVTARNELITKYNAVSKYCVSSYSSSNSQTSTNPLSDKPNQTALIIIGCLVLVIIIVNVIICIVYVFMKRQKKMKKATTRARASRENYYQ